jgi:amino acid transporter
MTDSVSVANKDSGREFAPSDDTPSRFGTFGGVFTPTVLTILGVIMYLRLGWVVGNAGLLGGFVIILAAFAITAATGLAMSSITTNIRIGAGGAYAIIAQSLGLEVGGSLGIPRYLSQALAVTMYIFGFREGWLWVFPEHSALLVDLVLFSTLFGIAYVSARAAIRVQYVIMAVIVGSLISVAVAAYNGSMEYSLDQVALWGNFAGVEQGDGATSTAFWKVFAVFFPATTGIMAGANMSGELEDPKRSIPIGTMAAVVVSLIIYLLLGYWILRSAPVSELNSNYYVMIEEARWGWLVLGGLLGACFSSALASLVGASRILQAMGDHNVVPQGEWLAQLSDGGEPRNAMWVTGALIFASLMLRDLNAVAPLITMFFLITYAMLNVVVLVEQSIGLVSFRPLLKIPRWVSTVGLVGSAFAMFIISPTISLISVTVVLAFYVILTRQSRRLDPSFQDVRSGLFFSLAEWAAKQTSELPEAQERAWKPNILMPVENTARLRGDFPIVQGLSYPQGSVKILGLADDQRARKLQEDIDGLIDAFRRRNVFATSAVVSAVDFEQGIVAGMQTLRGQFFHPNTLFLHLPPSMDDERTDAYQTILDESHRVEIGTILYVPHLEAGTGQQSWINVWVRDRSPEWRISWDVGNLDLSMLAAYKLEQNWDAKMRLVMAVEDASELSNARKYLEQVREVARMPEIEIHVAAEPFERSLQEAPHADINVFGLREDPDFEELRRMSDQTESSCLFVRDSGHESAFA